MRKILSALMPPLVTVVLFLALFNNSDHGRLVLAAVAVINLLVPAVFAGWAKNRLSPYSTATALCCATALLTLLAVESLFPVVLPQEYAQIRELTKHLVSRDAVQFSGASIIFTNDDQISQAAAQRSQGNAGSRRHWHSPGGRFAYYGYDPNLKTQYINEFHWNSHGYYDHDYGVDRSENVRRIVVIGDSYVEAVQVPLSRSFHKLAETALNVGLVQGGGRKTQVVALGNSGTGQVEHLKVLKNQALGYKPDAVVFGLSLNDFCDDDPYLKRELVLASGTITPLTRRLAVHGCYASAFAVRRMDDLQRNRIGICPLLLQWSQPDIPGVEAAWERTLGTILEARDVCAAAGIPFLLVYLGSDLEVKYALDPNDTLARLKAMGGPHAEIRWDLSKSIRRADAFCREHGIPMISLLEPLITAQRETGQHVFGDHFTMFGHEVAAQVLSCALHHTMESGVLADRAPVHCTALSFRRPTAPFGVAAAPAGQPVVQVVPASSSGLPAR
ncbi:MAG: SGNH/GDSL hydrolase family protein [Pseudomonadota bacterium]